MCIWEGKRVFVTRQVVCYYQLLMLLCQHFRPGNVSNHKMEGCQNIDKRKSSLGHTKCYSGNLSSFKRYLSEGQLNSEWIYLWEMPTKNHQDSCPGSKVIIEKSRDFYGTGIEIWAGLATFEANFFMFSWDFFLNLEKL